MSAAVHPVSYPASYPASKHAFLLSISELIYLLPKEKATEFHSVIAARAQSPGS